MTLTTNSWSKQGRGQYFLLFTFIPVLNGGFAAKNFKYR